MSFVSLCRAFPLSESIHSNNLNLFKQLPPETRKNTIYIMLTYEKQTSNEPICIDTLLGEFNAYNSAEFLKILMSYVNISLVQEEASEPQRELEKLDDVLEEAIYHPSPLFTCIYSLCTKRNHLPTFNSQSNCQETSTTVTVYLICELIKKINNPLMSAGLHGFLTDQFGMYCTSDKIWNLLTKFKLVNSKANTNRKQDLIIQNDLELEKKFSKYGLQVLKYDNLGFRMKSGYFQTIILIWNNYTFYECLKIGLYDCSWQRNNSILLDGLNFTPNDLDYLCLNTFYRNSILNILDEIVNIPTFDEFKQIDGSQNVTYACIDNNVRIFYNFISFHYFCFFSNQTLYTIDTKQLVIMKMNY